MVLVRLEGFRSSLVNRPEAELVAELSCWLRERLSGHHAEAPTYRRLLDHFRPRLLLGLTATPERGDGQSITGWFDGQVAAELRVWDALQRGLLAPFHYFGLHDNTDLRSLRWQRGRYDAAELEAVYTGNDARAMLVLKQVRAHVADPGRMRCLGFCAGVAHARFMAERFAEAGLAAVAVLGDTREEERREALRGLREGTVQAVFTVDVFNEGVDVPEVDTVLLLRPTESATIFLQQLGRGLRLAEGKACLTVLDFIGMARAEFRFDVLYRGLVPGTRRELVAEVEGGFPSLPSGCSMQLDRVASGVVLDNLRSQLRSTRAFLRRELREVGPTASLAEFLARAGVELEDLYRGDSPGWGQLPREVDFPVAEGDPRDLRSVARLVHADSLEQLRWTREHLAGRTPVGARDERMAAMLAASPKSRLPRPVGSLLPTFSPRGFTAASMTLQCAATRDAEVRGAYRCAPEIDDLNVSHVAVFDDFITRGTTMEDCAGAIRTQLPSATVFGIAMAKTVRREYEPNASNDHLGACQEMWPVQEGARRS